MNTKRKPVFAFIDSQNFSLFWSIWGC